LTSETNLKIEIETPIAKLKKSQVEIVEVVDR
jgi:hypothetical protein